MTFVHNEANRDTHQTGTVDEIGLVCYVRGCRLVQEAGVYYRSCCFLLIDVIVRGKELLRGFQQAQCEFDICEPITQVRAKCNSRRVGRNLSPS